MPEALSIYETLPQTAKQEVNDFIYFVAARINYAKASKKDFFCSFVRFLAFLC